MKLEPVTPEYVASLLSSNKTSESEAESATPEYVASLLSSQTSESEDDNVSEIMDAVFKAARPLLQMGLQGHVAVGAVSWACVGLAAVALKVVSRALGKKAADLKEPELEHTARIISGLAHIADAANTVDSAVGVVRDPVGSALNASAGVASQNLDPSEADSMKRRTEKILNAAEEIAKEDPQVHPRNGIK